MYTPISFFNYSPQLYNEVSQAGLIFSECSILRLLCFKDGAASATEKLAINGFETWAEEFLNNSNRVFQSGNKDDVNRYSSQFIEHVLSYLLVASLYDFTRFTPLNQPDKASFVAWENGNLIRVRLLSDLL